MNDGHLPERHCLHQRLHQSVLFFCFSDEAASFAKHSSRLVPVRTVGMDDVPWSRLTKPDLT